MVQVNSMNEKSELIAAELQDVSLVLPEVCWLVESVAVLAPAVGSLIRIAFKTIYSYIFWGWYIAQF